MIKTGLAKVTPILLPFFGAMIAALMVITYVPSVSLWLPVQTRQIKAEEVENAHFMNQPEESAVKE